MAAPAPLPKPGSPAMREVWAVAKASLDLPRSIVVIEGALDRKTMDELLQKAMRGTIRASAMQRAEVVGRLADWFHNDEATATAIMRELDKSSSKERHIVASIDEEHLTERLKSYRALDFRRERARLVWALVRDGRDAHRKASTWVLDEAFAALAEKERLSDAIKQQEPADATLLTELQQKLSGYEEAIREQQKQLQREVGSKEAVERERAELVARLGAREKALRDEENLRRADLVELARVKAEVQRLSDELQAADPARIAALTDENHKLNARVRSLERAADRAARLVELEEELATARKDKDDSERDAAQRRDALEEQLRQLLAREASLQFKIDELRDSLKDARQQLARGPQVHKPPQERSVGIFVDDANLSASARRDLGSRLDYRALLDALTDSRPRKLAIAFVVDSPDTAKDKHEAFTQSLRNQGWELREKRAKVRHDGSRKADWDMGMAMEMLDAVDDVDVIIIGSGDGDFVPLVKRLKRAGKRVEVAAFRASTDEALIAAVDAFLPLDGRFRLNR